MIDELIPRYEAAKRLDKRFDFCDILARYGGISFTIDGVRLCQPEGEPPPGVLAYYFDECQDSSALIDRVCRRLAAADGVRHV